MTQPVYILGGYQTDFAKVWSRQGQDISDMLRESTLGTLENCRLEAREIGSIHVGNAFGELQRKQAHLGAMVGAVVPELWGVPAGRHEGACASASLAVLAAMAEIEAGRYDCVLVLGAEEFKNLAGDVASQNQNAAGWVGHERLDCKFLWPAVFGHMALEYEKRYGLDRKYLNRISEINYGNARKNPLSQTRKWQFNEKSFSDDDEANPLIEPGTRRQDCGQITDGACGVVLASAQFARAHAEKRGGKLTGLPQILGWGHRTAGLPYIEKIERSAGQALIMPHVRDTLDQAFRRAGLADVWQLDGIETHDCFTTTEYMAIDHFGLTPPGQSWQAIEDGIIEPGGKLPINRLWRTDRLRPSSRRHRRAHAVRRRQASDRSSRADPGGGCADLRHPQHRRQRRHRGQLRGRGPRLTHARHAAGNLVDRREKRATRSICASPPATRSSTPAARCETRPH